MAPNVVVLFSFYALSLGIYAFSLYTTLEVTPVHRPIAGFGRWSNKLSYLTQWDVVFQIVLCVVTLGEIFAKGRQSSTNPSNLKRFLSRGVCGPTGLFVVITFWALYAVDPDFVQPRSWKGIPQWWNHSVHTMPFLTAVVDRFLSDLRPPAYKRNYAQVGLNIVASVFLSWLLYLGTAYNFWLYPVFSTLDSTGKAVFIAFLFFVLNLLFYACDCISRQFWK